MPSWPVEESHTATVGQFETTHPGSDHSPRSDWDTDAYISSVTPGTDRRVHTYSQPDLIADSPDRTTPSPQNPKGSSPVDQERRVASPGRQKQGSNSLELTEEEKQELRELKARDAEVRRHEQAHVMAGGKYVTSRAQFEYVVGPDGKLYAVGGEVQIDTSEVPNDPEATIEKAQTVRRAALAPSDPSPQDQRVAAEATRMEFEARMELSRERTQEAQEQTDEYDQEGQASSRQPESVLISLYA